jgi:hypothetical protein
MPIFQFTFSVEGTVTGYVDAEDEDTARELATAGKFGSNASDDDLDYQIEDIEEVDHDPTKPVTSNEGDKSP